MKRAATTLILLTLTLVASLGLTTRSDAALRVPQVPVLGGTLQASLNSIGQTINVLTQQDATQIWTHTASATTEYTIQFQNSPNAALHTFGLYNASAAVPTLVPLVSGAVGPLGVSTATFKPGNVLVVSHFDAGGNFLSQQTFNGVEPTGFSFYLQGPLGTFFAEDFRNSGGKAQALAFMGTGTNAGTWWLCWEESSVAAGSDQDFDDEVILMSSVNTTPVSKTTWGQLKARFR